MTAPGDPVPTVTELLLARADDANPGLAFEDRRWSWKEHVQECADRAALLRSLRRPGPFHVGVLLDNVPEFSFLLGGAALAGAVLVGLNTSRRGEALVRDIKLADCQVVLTDSRYVELLQGLNIGARVLDIDSAAWHVTAYRHQYSPLEVGARDAGRPADADLHVRHQRRAEGGPVHPRQDHRARRAARGPVRAGRRRHRVRVDADVPLERDHRRLGGRPGRGRQARAAAAVLGVRLPRRRPRTTASPTPTTSANRCPTS